MAVKALVHLRFMKSRRYFVRTNWRYRKHCCENDNATASARGDLKYHVGDGSVIRPVQHQRYASLRRKLDQARRSALGLLG